MTSPDQNPPPHTMSDKSDKEISREILARGVAAQICLMTPATFDKIYDTALTAIDQSTAAMRDELERVKGEAENLLWNLAGCDTYAMGYGLDSDHDKSAARPALESCRKMALQNVELRTQLAVQSAKIAELEAQAGAMREALTELVGAAWAVVYCTPENRATYPDGPCINKEERQALVAAAEKADAALSQSEPSTRNV